MEATTVPERARARRRWPVSLLAFVGAALAAMALVIETGLASSLSGWWMLAWLIVAVGLVAVAVLRPAPLRHAALGAVVGIVLGGPAIMFVVVMAIVMQGQS